MNVLKKVLLLLAIFMMVGYLSYSAPKQKSYASGGDDEMGVLTLPKIPRGADMEQVINIYNMAIEEMEHRINGFLQSSNIQEVGGWKVSQTELKSKDNDVGMSTEDTAADDVRFWSGETDKNAAPWRVTKGGKMTATGARIESSPGSFPNILIDPDNDTITVYFASDKYVGIGALYDATPNIKLVNGANTALINLDTDLEIQSNVGITMASSQDITLTTVGNTVLDYSSVTEGAATTLRDILNGLQTSIDDLQTNKADKAVSTSSDGAASLNGGIAVGTQLAVNGGGFVTWGGIDVPAHSHTQN